MYIYAAEFRYIETARLCLDICQSKSYKDGLSRSAISRAYYGLFCYARNFARDHEGLKLTQSSIDHHETINHYKNNQEVNHNDVGLNLERILHRRNSADYDDVYQENKKPTDPLNAADYTVRKVEELFKKIDSFPRK